MKHNRAEREVKGEQEKRKEKKKPKSENKGTREMQIVTKEKPE